MSERAFQSELVRLVMDPRLRDKVRKGGRYPAKNGLTQVERADLVAIAAQPGLNATRVIYKGFRLSKILPQLPLTCQLLGHARLGREVSRFWDERPPYTFHYLEEANSFCDFLLRRRGSGLRVAYLEEVVTYERAILDLRRPGSPTNAARQQSVAFEHDPLCLLGRLAKRLPPGRVPMRKCQLVGTLQATGEIYWELMQRVDDANLAASRRVRRAGPSAPSCAARRQSPARQV